MFAMNLAKIDFGDFSTTKIDDHQPPTMRKKLDLLWQIITADNINDNINTATIGQVTRHLQKIFSFIIDCSVSAKSANCCTFGFVSCRGKNFGTKGLSNLDRSKANTACATLNQNGFTSLKLATIHHIRPDRAENLRQACRVNHRHSVGNSHTLTLWRNRIF